jgi:hypothetical protein
MRTRTGWLVGFLTAGIALAPRPGWGQDVPPADHPILPLPLWHDRPERGGFYAAGDFLYWRQTNPLRSQTVAVRGLDDVDGSLQRARDLAQTVPIHLNSTGLDYRAVVDPNTGIPIFVTNAVDPNTGLPIINSGQIFNGMPLPNGVPLQPADPQPGKFLGSAATALDVHQLTGPNTYQPGWSFTAGWRFSDAFTLEFNWRHIAEARYSAVASLVPPNFNIGRNGEDQFLFSPVYNFPPEFSGPVQKLAVTPAKPIGSVAVAQATPINAPVNVGGISVLIPTDFATLNAVSTINPILVPQAAYGIWNAATIMSIDFVQRYDEYEIVGRIPIYQDDCMRWYGICGIRHVAMWERFKWRTVAVSTAIGGQTAQATLNGTTPNTGLGTGTGTPASFNGGNIAAGTQFVISAPAVSGADDVADYTNIVSNQLYGPVVGCGTEWYLGWGLAFSLDLRAALHIDFVKERARYEREDKAIANKRARRQELIVPELDAIGNIWWYPIEGVEVRVGYDLLNYFNTAASPRPVDFNYGALAPAWEKGTYRFFEGFHAGIGFIF